jgi:hypothetical protein
MVKNRKETVSVILTAYKRLEFLNLQIDSVLNQTIKPKKVYVWYNNPDKRAINLEDRENIILVNSSENLGVWARFQLALGIDSDYICILDDDTIPGAKWFENCVDSIKKNYGLYGTRGLRFNSDKSYFDYSEFGWRNPNENIEEVDIVGHAWFFPSELIKFFWETHPFRPMQLNAGEDIHFSYSLQMKGIKTYVPPHPIGGEEMWGSNYNLGNTIGSDENAISNQIESFKKFQTIFQRYINSGFIIANDKIDNKNVSIGKGVFVRIIYYKYIIKIAWLKKIVDGFNKLLKKLKIRL